MAGADLIERADAFFARLNRGYTVKVRDTGQDDDLQSACEAGGLEPFGDPAPEMICRHRLDDPKPPEGVELRVVADGQGVDDFAAVNANAYATYGMPTDVLPDMFDRPAPLLADLDTVTVVAYQGSRPVATAQTYMSDGIAGLYWVGAISEARHMGLGRVVTRWATNEAFDQGASSCTLQASIMGEPLYTQLGYEILYRYQNYTRWGARPT